ncbi:MptD family putative ECF transporter S component [Hathewaya limosa]|uniref:Energy-coupling factor transport system substrate-specific component n=1 Tax=Hathewaya limosa TaxID=1536 RepID=A0ABU0JP33_HATLI|nr:MptD family putative ECF transporter S component [Hathewaya limosa]MDQ0478850.1 energy-coupling factor transport system substrate-specific component [Hathewaya limosa]
MLNRESSKKMRGKDFITMGIFSAIYFVINFAVMLLGGFHPILWIFMPAIIAIFAAAPFLIMTAKVQKFGAVLLMGSITSLIYLATGQFTMVILITFAISCFLAELFRYKTGYNDIKGNILVYAFYSMGMIGSPLPIWLFKDKFLAQIAELGMPATYISQLEELTSPIILILMVIAPFICSFIGVAIVKPLFKKHFEKAGII